jgi:hypothetical protein
MPFSLLVPAFLAGLAALLVPLVLHLRRRDRQKPRPFPSLMFLTRLPVVTDRRRRITDWPLLLLRALLIALLVLAFARPYRRQSTPPVGGSAGLTVLLIDRSQSMSHRDVASVWLDSAEAVIDGLAEGRRVAVVAFDTDASILLSPTPDHASAKAILRTAPAAAGGTRFGAGLRAASQLLAGEQIPGEVVVVSDLQRIGASAAAAPALAVGTTLRTVVVSPANTGNRSVTELDVQALPASTGRLAVVAARIIQSGNVVAEPVTVTLEVDGREADRREVVLPAAGGVRVSFDTVAIARGDARVAVRLEPDALNADDIAYGIVPAISTTRVLLIAPPGTALPETRYLQRALEIGTEPSFEITRSTTLDRRALDQGDVVILYDVMPTGAQATMLKEWVDQGNGVIVLAGERITTDAVSVELVPARVRRSTETDALGLGEIVTSHPALEAFREVGAAGFASVRIRRHPQLELAGGGTVLLRYDDGSPAVIAATEGLGRAMMVAIPINNQHGDFPLRPAFLPFIRGITTWAAGGGPPALAVTSGEPWRVPGNIGRPVIRNAQGDITRPPSGAGSVTIRASGIHEVHDGQPGGTPAALIAVNAPASESELSSMPPGELVLGIGDAAGPVVVASGETPPVMEARQRGWRWVLLAVLGLLIIEVLVASLGWRGIASSQAVVSGGGVK